MTTTSKMDKIQKLLAKAEGTDNQHERDTYTAKAQRLMLEWGIEEADLISRSQATREDIVEVSRQWNSPYATTWVSFTNAVAWGMGHLKVLRAGSRNCHRAYVIGHQSDVNNLWTLMTSLELQASAAMAAWWKTAWQRGACTSWEAYLTKREFIKAYGEAVAYRLWQQREQLEQQAPAGAALVLADKGGLVQQWVDDRYNKLGSARGASSQGLGGTAAGRAAGMRADLGGPQGELG